MSSQNKENRGLMERLTSEANARSQIGNRLQGLEAQLEKLNDQKASLEAREKKVKDAASQVSSEVEIDLSVFVFCFAHEEYFTSPSRSILILNLDNCAASEGSRGLTLG